MLAACGPAPPKAADATPTPVTIDLTGWTTSVHGVGPHATEKNGRLELTMPGSTYNNQNWNDLSVRIIAPCQLSGDFEITAHYTLVTWPPANGVWVGLTAGDFAVARVSNRNGPDNRYAAYMVKTLAEIETRDMTGTLRLTRVGATLTGYYEDATGGWVRIGSANAPSQELPYAIEAASNASFGKSDVVAAFDHLNVSGTKVSCS